ncbi:chorismate mutase [Lactarius quietus]|nr:chorismate mutase [Lactarius quietus]
MQANYTLAKDPLSLDRIRSILTRFEDTIIFSLIERAQFAHNPGYMSFKGSWLEWFLKETEAFHGARHVFSLPHPDEYPFTTGLPAPVLPSPEYPPILFPNKINVNASILSFYIRSIVPRITVQATLTLASLKRSKGIAGDDELEDDGNYGSAATVDVEVLQAISKRVHYGKFVSESKFRQNPAAFVPHIQHGNTESLAALITNPEVERRLLIRLRKKAMLYAQDFANDGEPQSDGTSKGKIDVDCVVDLYESYIIPLTKEVEVDYLLQRLDGLSQEEIDKLSNSKH